MIMRTGPILIILACLLPLCTCELSFDELTAVDWDVYDIESDAFKEGEPQSIQLIFRPSRGLTGREVKFYQDFDLTRPLNTNKLVYINGKPLSGEGGAINQRLYPIVAYADFYIHYYTEAPVKTGDVFTFDQSWFFVKEILWGAPTKKYKVRIITDSIVFKEKE
jgi:hypothetical protein